MDKALAELIKISSAVGKDTALVQGGGGNTSVKTDDGKYMFIKASGTALKDMNAERGWRRLDLGSVLNIIQDKKLAAMPASPREIKVVNLLNDSCDDNQTNGARPSVEAHLHAILDKAVIHLHPTSVGAFVNSVNGRKKAEKLFKDLKLPILWVGYVDPGLMLAVKINKLVANYVKQYGKKPQILFLEKHGLFVTAPSAQAALKITNDVIKKCASGIKLPALKNIKTEPEKIKSAALAIRKAIFEQSNTFTTVINYKTRLADAFICNPQIKTMLAKPALTPDELVYANGAPIWIEKPESAKIKAVIAKQTKDGGKCPLVYAVKDLGFFIAAKPKQADIIGDIIENSLVIRFNALKLGGISALNKREINFINNWEAEAFRQKVAVGANDGIIKDRIAIVTGAGSGIGKSLAIGLARAGAIVAIADIDATAANETAAIIRTEIPTAAVMPVICNVTSEDSVKQAFENLIAKFGGLDILVNAAGVAPAYPLTELAVDKWRFALEVNLTGYFLMAKYAARIMIEQAIGGSIVNISSKSGIDPSKNNSAYNATKAGELHMSRGWAMELGEYGIRVNSVCPGNVFEGSKIWNPEYIKVCAKKYGIKPEEVIPYYVSKSMLKKEIKGQDIADTVVFLCSDNAKMITAQTMVVDCGQAMTR